MSRSESEFVAMLGSLSPASKAPLFAHWKQVMPSAGESVMDGWYCLSYWLMLHHFLRYTQWLSLKQ